MSVDNPAFDTDSVNKISKEVIENVIGGNSYQHSKVDGWSNQITKDILEQLIKHSKPFKYVVSCVIVQKNGAGLHTATSSYWDNSTDGYCNVRWENKSLYCIIQLFSIAI